MKTRMSLYPSTQEKFKNLCSRHKDMEDMEDMEVMDICLCHVETTGRDRSFFTSFSFVCSEKR